MIISYVLQDQEEIKKRVSFDSVVRDTYLFMNKCVVLCKVYDMNRMNLAIFILVA